MKRILLIMIGVSAIVLADFSRSGEIVTDSKTGLQWQDDANAGTVTRDWAGAIDYCENQLNLGGYNDWRLPNFNELYFLADRSKRNPDISSVFQNIVSDDYWSSTTIVGYEDFAWGVDFGYGNGSGTGKSYASHVRCVRAGQDDGFSSDTGTGSEGGSSGNDSEDE